MKQQLSPEQISSTFGLCERPVKKLIRDYFVQFDPAFIKKGKGPVMKNGVRLAIHEVPKEYIDTAGMLKMVHTDPKKNLIDSSRLTPDSLLKIPENMAHLSLAQKKNADGSISVWGLDLHLRDASAKFDKESLAEFCKDAEPDPATGETYALRLMGGFLPAATFIFNLLKTKNKVLETLDLAYHPGKYTLMITDTRFPNLAPNKCLVIKLTKKEDMKNEPVEIRKKNI